MIDDTTTQNPVDPTMPAVDPAAPVTPTPTPTPTPTMDVPATEPNLPGDVPATETPATEVPVAPVTDQPVADNTQM